MRVLSQFDKSMTEVLGDKVKARMNFKVLKARCFGGDQLADTGFFKGHLDTYRFCDEVWTFLIKDVNFKLDNQSNVQADKIKIVSCNAKKPGEQ